VSVKGRDRKTTASEKGDYGCRAPRSAPRVLRMRSDIWRVRFCESWRDGTFSRFHVHFTNAERAIWRYRTTLYSIRFGTVGSGTAGSGMRDSFHIL
jgi:ribosomal protein L37AE/L43A